MSVTEKSHSFADLWRALAKLLEAAVSDQLLVLVKLSNLLMESRAMILSFPFLFKNSGIIECLTLNMMWAMSHVVYEIEKLSGGYMSDDEWVAADVCIDEWVALWRL